MRRASRIDKNHREIVDTLLAMGWTVQHLHNVGHGCPDIICGADAMNILLEIKSDKGKLTPQQQEWHDKWCGQAAVVRDSDQAVAIVCGCIGARIS